MDLKDLAADLRDQAARLNKAADALDPKPTKTKSTNGRKRRGRPPKTPAPALDSGDNQPPDAERPSLGLG